MTQTMAGAPVTLVSQWYDFLGGTLTDLDATPTITITNAGTGAVALSATTSGVSHPGTGAYGYVWTPSAALAGGTYLVQWAGAQGGTPVTAQEIVTVLTLASAAAANTDPGGIWYVTRERVARATSSTATAITASAIDAAIEAGARQAEAICNGRRFYPTLATRYIEWPGRRPGRTGYDRVYLGESSELISLTSLTSGGTAISADNVRLEPVNSGPPYTRIELWRGGSASWDIATPGSAQRSLVLAGAFGGCAIRETAAGALAEALDDSETLIDVTGACAARTGVGSILRADSERMIVTERGFVTTSTTTSGALTASMTNDSFTVSSGTGYAVGEVILIDSERMIVTNVAGNVLTVKRAWDGTTLATHVITSTVYASRQLSVTRGALGTTAAAHADTTALYLLRFPGPVEAYNLAYALTQLAQESSGYARTIGTGENVRETGGRGLKAAADALRADPRLRRQAPQHGAV